MTFSPEQKKIKFQSFSGFVTPISTPCVAAIQPKARPQDSDSGDLVQAPHVVHPILYEKIMRIFSHFFIMVAVFFLATGSAVADNQRLKAGFIYTGPVSNDGWSRAHDIGRVFAMEKLPWLDTTYRESVATIDLGQTIDDLIQKQGMDVIFTTSFDYMEETVKAAIRYPDKRFMHCSGTKRAHNLGTYSDDLYQMYYLNGIMAGALTKTNQIGYVAAFPIPDVIRHINAFALGIKATNPNAQVRVRWIYAWNNPDKAREAAETLIEEGADTLAFTEDTPTVIQVGQEYTESSRQIYTFSHYSSMLSYGKDSAVSGQLADWGRMYIRILQDIKDHTWTNDNIRWLAREGAALLGADFGEIINLKFKAELESIIIPTKEFGRISAYDLVIRRYAQMKKGVHIFDPFTGPIRDNRGKLRIKRGAQASEDDLLNITYYVDNVMGDIPGQSIPTNATNQ